MTSNYDHIYEKLDTSWLKDAPNSEIRYEEGMCLTNIQMIVEAIHEGKLELTDDQLEVIMTDFIKAAFCAEELYQRLEVSKNDN